MPTPPLTPNRSPRGGPPALAARPAVVAHPEPRLWTRPFVRLCVVHGGFGLSFSAFALLPKFLAERHASALDIGVVTSMWGLAGVVVSPIVGPLLDRHGRRIFVLGGLAIMAASAFGFLLVDAYGPLAVGLRFAQGVAFALVFNGLVALVGDGVSPLRLGRAVGMLGAASLSTQAISPALAEYLARVSGWASAFAAAGIVGVATLAIAWRIREPRRHAVTLARPGTVPLTRNGTVRGALVGNFACGVGLATLATFHQPYALELGIGRIGDFFVAFTLTGLVVRLGLGGLVDRWGARRMAIGSLVLYAAAVGAGAILDRIGLAALGAGLGVAHGIFFPSVVALGMGATTPLERGRVSALLNTSFSAGVSSVILLGPLAEYGGYPVVFFAAAAWVGGSVLALARMTRATVGLAPATAA